MTAPRLIINADDLGWAAARDEVILALARQGHISSASLIVNGANAKTAAQAAIAQHLPLGLHLNLSEGPALTGPSTLTTPDGDFFGKSAQRDRFDQNAIALVDLQLEIRAQIERFIEWTGTRPTHLDSHHHLHTHPALAGVLAPIMAREYSLYRIRQLTPEPGLDEAWANQPEGRTFHQRIEVDGARAWPIYQAHQLYGPDRLIGRALMGHRLTAARLKNALTTDSALWTELMCHPGAPSANDNAFGQSAERQHEAATLAAPDFVAARATHTLGQFGQLRRPKVGRRRILIYGKLSAASGNATTAERLARDLAPEFDVLQRHEPDAVPQDTVATTHEIALLKALREKESIDLAIGIHLYRAGHVFHQAFGNGLPTVLIASGTDVNVNSRNSAHHAAMANALRAAQGLICLHDGQLVALRESFPQLPARILIQMPTPDLHTDSQYSLRAELNLPADAPLILLPAGIRPVKGIAFAIEAAAQALIEHPNHVFVVLGPPLDPDYHAHCSSLAIEWRLRHRSLKGRLLLRDALPRPDYLAALREAALVLNTSESEGLSNVLLETMGSGVPVLARSVAGNTELVREGENGLLFGSLGEFLRQYRRLFAEPNLRETLIAGGRAEYDHRHQPETQGAALRSFVRS